MWVYAHHGICVELRGHLQELDLLFHHVGLGDHTALGFKIMPYILYDSGIKAEISQ